MIQPTTRFGLPRSLGSTVFKVDDPLEGWVVPQSAECTTVVTPDCIRRLYKINQLAGPDPRNKLGVSGFLEQYARYTDFNAFINRYAHPLKGKSFEVAYVNNGENLQNSSRNSGEASLDIQYTVALSNATAVYYSTGGRGPLVPDLDQPDPQDISNEPYLEQLLYFRSLKDEDLPSVLSTSYGENEQSVPKNYTDAICDMFCELGARGVSIIFSSGDDGPGNSCQTNDGKNTTRFNPIFPAACPFVTSVGGTILREVEEGVYYSSGGFSDRHARPEYQAKAVQGYLDQLGSRWEGLYNRLGRGFPDVAALGSNFSIFDHGGVHLISGTRFVSRSY
jgi:tripeptidyl-peptidase-1